MSASVFLCHADALAEGHFREFLIRHDDRDIHVVATRHGGVARAWLNICPHQGRPLNWAPDQFITDHENRLICAAHGAVFEPRQGLCVSGPCKNASLRGLHLTEHRGEVRVNPAIADISGAGPLRCPE